MDLETNENGKISIINLPYGDYIIREIETLDGYEKKDEEIKFSINNTLDKLRNEYTNLINSNE